jgi:hypothetical protein
LRSEAGTTGMLLPLEYQLSLEKLLPLEYQLSLDG